MDLYNMFEQFEDVLPGGFFVYQALEGETLVYANHKTIAMFQCNSMDELRQLTGNSFKGMVHPIDYERIESEIERELKKGQAADHVTYRIMTKNGEILWVDDFGRFFDDPIYGPVFAVFLHDITDSMHVKGLPCSIDIPLNKYLTKTVGQQKIENEDVQLLMDEAREAMGADLLYLFEGLPTNDGFEVTFESKKSDKEGILGIRKMIGVKEYALAEKHYDENRMVSYLTNLTRKKGAILSYGIFHNKIYDGSIGLIRFGKEDLNWSEDEEICIQKLGRAIHQALLFSRLSKVEEERRRQQEKLEIALKAKSTFLNNVSHDIRTPMNAVMGFTQLAMENIADMDSVRDYLDKIKVSGEHMLHIINDVLDMSKIESGKLELKTCSMNLEEEILSAMEMVRSAMEKKGLAFHTEISLVENCIIGDPVRLKQILVNLLTNSVKYTNTGGDVWLRANQTGIHDDGTGTYCIIVKDSGIGMSEEFQKHIFKNFERERNATVSGIQGTGLGLAICKELVELMGGTIVCESKMGEGTTFTVTFCAKVENMPQKQIADPFANVNFSGKRILLVEDNVLNREIAASILETKGLEIVEAEDGAVAVEKMKKAVPGEYDLILMDIQMPFMNGYQATKTIRNLENRELAEIPIIAMTADAFSEDREKAFAAGMNEHLAKPINFHKLFQLLYEYLLK